MPKFKDWINPFSSKNPYNKKTRSFLEGTPEVHEQVPNLLPNQLPLQEQQAKAAQERGAGGVFGESADYHRNMLSDDSADINAFNAPHLRQFNEEIIPGISEQFAGMGAGGLSSSGFRNAATTAGVDLAERLGSIRANLRQNSANALQNIGQNALTQYSSDKVTEPGTGGFLATAAPIAGAAAGAYFGGPQGAAIGYAGGQQVANHFGGNKVGYNSDPYKGGNIQASPRTRSV
jgi:hypothetical protein